VVEVETLSMGGVDDASVGVDEASCDVATALESVDVAATWARTGLTMANPMMSAPHSLLLGRNGVRYPFPTGRISITIRRLYE
jgi:hypothetical protein